MYSHPLPQRSLLCQCLKGAPVPVPVSAVTALLHLLLGLGLFIPLLRQAFSNTRMTFKILLPQVGHIPICVCFADSAGPRGCCSILMNSLQAWMVLLTNIMYAVSIFIVHGSAQPSAGLACPWLRHRVSWVGLTQHPSHGFFYLLKALGLIIIILVAETYFLKKFFFFFLQRECCWMLDWSNDSRNMLFYKTFILSQGENMTRPSVS